MKRLAVPRQIVPPAGVGLTAMWLLAGCGANMQAVYEADVRFEHCMVLDIQPEVRLERRRACWREWLEFYTYGQTPDRVIHAEKRVRDLEGPGVPASRGASASGEGRPSHGAGSSPAPSSGDVRGR